MNLWNIIQPALMLISAGIGIVLMAVNLRKARTIEDTPTAKIRSAAQGYLSISGIARTIDNDIVIAPLSGKPCLWYHYTIEKCESGDNSSRWNTIERGTSEKFFVIDDSTDICHIDPRRAEVSATVSQSWQGDARKPTSAPHEPQKKIGLSLLSRHYPFLNQRYRYTEKRIHAQEWIYALGWFETLHAPSLAERTEAQTKILLNEWKQDRDTLLARFDLNRDGEISLPEWERARRAARQQIEQSLCVETATPAINTMSHSPLREHPYLITTQDPRDMAHKYRRDAIIALGVGFIFSAFIFWKYIPY